jgi:imidazolonepropionase-like amidohydrolase
MYSMRVLLLIAASLAVVASQFGQQPASNSFAIEHVTVINVETGARSAEQTVVVSGNRIASVAAAPGVGIPAGTRRLDGRGKFLMPGVWDMHVHGLRFMRRALPLAVANGITGLRDMGSTLDQVAEARRGGFLAPRLFVAGPLFDGVANPNSRVPQDVVRTPEEGRQLVRKVADAKMDLVKIHVGVARDTFFAVADEAKRRGLPFDGHLAVGLTIAEASDAGQRTIEHLDGLRSACVVDAATLDAPKPNAPPDSKPIAMNRAKCSESIQHLVRNGTWLTPTIGAPGSGDARNRQFNVAITRMAAEAGVRLLPGTDWPGGGYAFGDFSRANPSIMDELAGLVEAGLTPQQALRTATVNPAILFKMTDQLGSIQSGKLADLLLLDADPLANIANLKRVAAIVVNGRLVDSAERQKIIADEIVARQNTSR